MAKYSKIYKVAGHSFRYNYDTCMLQAFKKPSKRELDIMRKDNEEWMEKFGHPLWTADELEGILDQQGLNPENWNESPEYWCDMYAEEINWMIKDAEREFSFGK